MGPGEVFPEVRIEAEDHVVRVDEGSEAVDVDRGAGPALSALEDVDLVERVGLFVFNESSALLSDNNAKPYSIMRNISLNKSGEEGREERKETGFFLTRCPRPHSKLCFEFGTRFYNF